MKKVTLGRSGITVNKDGLGALPLQRTEKSAAVRLIRAAVDGGLEYTDTARAYSDSEEKLGAALEGRRGEVILATKSGAGDAKTLEEHLDTSLRLLRTDVIDVYQFHNPNEVPGEESELYQALLRAKKAGKIRVIGITNHRLHLAEAAARSGLYDVLQYPLSYLSGEREVELARECERLGVGFVSMKALAGGLITDIDLAVRFQNQFAGVVPIWGLQRESELDALLKARDANAGAGIGDNDRDKIKAELENLGGDFCRGCGYCSPCPQGIQIFNCARTSLLIRRAPGTFWLGDDWRGEMRKINGCTRCGQCAAKCPYGLDIPALLRRNLEDYESFAGR